MTKRNPTLSERQEPQTLSVSSTAPILCSLPNCSAPTREVKNGVAYIILNTGIASIVAHCQCLGINMTSDITDPAYHRYIGCTILARFSGK